jgi:hypothetical protein
MRNIILLTLCISTSFAATEKEALQTIKKYGKALKKELKSALKVSPINALKVCNTKAPEIENKLKTEAIEVGRVSTKNRNPKNVPKKWMQKAIKKFENKKNKKPYEVVKISEDRSGLLKPIATMPMCLKCHGDNIDAKLMSEIQKLYPKDKAINYQVGDIRGYFWAEFNPGKE